MVMVSRLLRDKQDTYRELSHSHIFFQFASHFSVFFNNYTLRCLAHRIQKFFAFNFLKRRLQRAFTFRVLHPAGQKIFREKEIITHTDTPITISSCVCPDGGCLDLTISLTHDCYRRWHQRILDFHLSFETGWHEDWKGIRSGVWD
jgi:hypothetical protein